MIREQFREAFGEPHRAIGKDWHWGLRVFSYIAAINILINGSVEFPIVWVFDPHDPSDGVTHDHVRSQTEIAPIIDRIQQRLRRAGRPDLR